jgi:hypothetical protein
MNIPAAPRFMALCAAIGFTLCGMPVRAQEDATRDLIDQDTLERALYLCQWKIDHDVPDNAPTPAVCRSDAVSTDDAMLQLKQWWTFWARLDAAAALRANQQFSADFAGFHSRLTLKPESAGDLLPPGIRLQAGDWRLRLVRELTRRYSARAPQGAAR